MKRIKLRLWVKVVITLIVMGLIIYLWDIVMHGNVSINFSIAYWLGLIPISFVNLMLVWSE